MGQTIKNNRSVGYAVVGMSAISSSLVTSKALCIGARTPDSRMLSRYR